VQSLRPAPCRPAARPLAVLLKFTPLWQVIRNTHGSGECGEVNWRFLGLAMPAWVLIWALILGWVGRDGESQARSRRSTLTYIRLQGVDVLDRTHSVDLVDGGVHHAELDHFAPSGAMKRPRMCLRRSTVSGARR